MSIEQFGWQDQATRQRLATRSWLGPVILLVVAFATRTAQFGDPINGLDAQYYHLVAGRLLNGAIPYVDIWDRKPWGIFALFAAFRLLGDGSMLTAKIAATLFAWLTAWLIGRTVVRFAPPRAALMAGIFYLLMLQQLSGGEPQTSVFYNLLVVAAYLLAMGTAPNLPARRDSRRVLAAMLLCGIAMQLKTNAVFEGGALGLWLVWRMHRADVPKARIMRLAGAMAVTGAAPAIAVAIGYASIGHFGEWWFANFGSQLHKGGGFEGASLARLRDLAMLAGPMVVMAGVGGRKRSAGGEAWGNDRPLLLLWAAVAAGDALVLGNFWAHYAIPFAAPASILAANVFALPRWGVRSFAILSLYPVLAPMTLDPIAARDNAAIARATLAAIPADARTRCLYIYEGPVAYYDLTHACLVTRFAFTDHLRSSAEASALGENATRALAAALARQPGTVITLENSEWMQRNRANDRLITTELGAHYRPVARLPHIHYTRGREWLVVWRRRDLIRHI